ncbi:MAG: metal-dependent hydrolase [Candidatus Hodarchaeota archaeon]
MPTLGMHALIGFLGGSQIKNKTMTVALIFGSLIPDIDIIVAVIAYFLPEGSMEASKYIHRSWSHSLITISIIFLIGLFVYQITKQQENTQLSNYGLFFTFMTIGMVVHSIADVVYIGYYSHADAATGYNPGVALFWPLSFDRYALLPIEVDDVVYNFLITSDFLTDSLFLYFPVIYLAYQTNTSIKVRKPLLIIAVIDAVIYGMFTMTALVLPIVPDDMIFYTYIPGIFDIILVMIFPLLTHETIEKIYKPLRSPKTLESPFNTKEVTTNSFSSLGSSIRKRDEKS